MCTISELLDFGSAHGALLIHLQPLLQAVLVVGMTALGSRKLLVQAERSNADAALLLRLIFLHKGVSSIRPQHTLGDEEPPSDAPLY